MENTEDIKAQIQAAELYNAMYNQQPQDPSLLPNQKCDKCQHTIFDNKYIIKKVKQNGQEYDMPISIFVCAKCGTVLKSMREELHMDEFATDNKKQTSTLIL